MSIRHASGEHSHSFQMTEKPPTLCPSESTLKPARPPRYRRPTVIVAQVAALLSIVFLLVVFAGNTANSPSLTKGLYFLRIDVSHVIPLTIPNATLVNSIAQTLGLRGFYQVGLWNYCQGYKETGVTDCSTPQAMYSFDPVAIILSQLLDGATIALPSSITNALSIAKVGSNCMFVCYFVGISFQAVVAVLGWFGTVSKRNTMIIGIMSFVAGFSTCIAAVVSTVLYCVFMTVFQSAPEFNIRANLGEPMFVCVWMAAGCALVSTLINLAACCCCCCCGRGRKAKRDDEKRRVLEMDQERE